MNTDGPLLRFDSVNAGYGRVHVLNGLSFFVTHGEVLGIIGPNGSGKTTMLNAINGLIVPTAGRILFAGRDITTASANKRCRMGIGRTFQIPRPFTRMTVYENLVVAAVHSAGLSEKECVEPALDVLRVTGLYKKRNDPSGMLTLLDLKRLEIARAIVARPQLLLLDEVAAGLTNEEVHEVMDLVAWLKEAGFTIVWIEHVLQTMLHSTDRLMCMADGTVAIVGEPHEVMHSKAVEELYLGNTLQEETSA